MPLTDETATIRPPAPTSSRSSSASLIRSWPARLTARTASQSSSAIRPSVLARVPVAEVVGVALGGDRIGDVESQRHAPDPVRDGAQGLAGGGDVDADHLG